MTFNAMDFFLRATWREDTAANNVTAAIPAVTIWRDTGNPTSIEELLHVQCVGNPSPGREAPLP